MQVHQPNELQNWLTQLDRRVYALVIGTAIGLIGGGLGLALILVGPLMTTGAILGLLVGLYVLTDVQVALYSIIAIMILLPFGTFPFSIGFIPTLLDTAIGGFLLIYLLQWMKRRRRSLRFTPVHFLLTIYIGWLILAFVLGLRYGAVTAQIARQFAETLLTLSLVFIISDLLRDPTTLRRLVLIVIILVGLQALISIGLYALPDATAETLLSQLSRIGYPSAGVIRYIESDASQPERAIGTWIDPNSLGGLLAITATMIAPQLFAKKPVVRYRWLTLAIMGVVFLALVLTFSRASALALVVAIGIITIVRYRRFIPLMLVGSSVLLLFPQSQTYVERFAEAFTGSDLATQMRIGEYSDSLRLIQRYPVFGVGFTGTPDIDIYTDVASMYLIMANQIGLIGVAIYLTTIMGVLLYGIRMWRFAKHDDELDTIHLGFHAALVAALVNAGADLYFFRLEYQGPIMLFWLTITLCLATSRLALERHESTVVKQS